MGSSGWGEEDRLSDLSGFTRVCSRVDRKPCPGVVPPDLKDPDDSGPGSLSPTTEVGNGQQDIGTL